MIAPLVFRHASHWKIQKVSAWQIFYHLLSITIRPTTRRNIPLLRFVSRRQPQLPRLLRRILGARGQTALNYAAQKGHAAVVELLISAGATVDAADNGGRGLGRVSGSFWAWLWRGDARGSYMGSWFSCCALRALSGIRTCCLRIHFCEWMGLLKFGYKKWPNMGDMSCESKV